MGSLLASMTEEEIARKYNNLVKRGKCLPLDSPEADSTEADSTEAATTVRRDVTPIAKPPVGQRSARSRRFIVNQNLDVGKATKGPKQWNPDEDDALIDVVKQYKFEYMTVTEVFHDVKANMDEKHLLYPRTEEALSMRYRKLLNEGKCPALRNSKVRPGFVSVGRNGADSSMKMSAAAGNGKKSGRGPNNEPAGNEKKTLRGPSNQDHARLFGPFGSNGNGTSMKKTDAAGNGKKSGRGPNNWSGLGNNEAFGSHGDIPSKNNSGAAGNRKKTGSGFNNNEPEPDLAGAVDVVLYYVAKKLAVLLRNFP
ncbi:unnamed protein product [Trifolium pratense]|uniref:Uncharacterized protein n=2 Tax=Trifolium pratense TaxID=57577 RepID=A0ACB0KKC4_TRIPR|nr:unnamed protein product [Trifolium pratense]CAJ2656380.1 unnamed protein product [Trifolium pratense]